MCFDKINGTICLTKVFSKKGKNDGIFVFLGNLLTILALPHARKLRTSATWFVVNLAVIEMMFCVTILPMSAGHLFHVRFFRDKLFDKKGCKLFVFLRYVLSQAELLSIAAIAINR